MNKSKVSVLMSVYNGEPFLSGSLKSVIAQTYSNFEFIVIDDASTDNSLEIIAGFDDPRIKIFKNDNNIGLTNSLNLALTLASGKYIARMDADDISLPIRFEKQVSFLDRREDIGVLGSWVDYIDKNNQRIMTWRTPDSPTLVDWKLRFGNQLAHSSVLFRRSLIEKIGTYNPDLRYGQDFDLWARASHYTNLANLPEVLIKRREWDANISSTYLELQEETAIRVIAGLVSGTFNEQVSFEDTKAFRRAVKWSSLANLTDISLSADWIERLYWAYVTSFKISPNDLEQIRRDATFRLCTLSRLSLPLSKNLFIRVLAKSVNLSVKYTSAWILSRVLKKLPNSKKTIYRFSLH